ncbi:hypothetical protein EDL99_04780 [Ornithobacterium rhinotracheale]|nr:hypothetical protein [Ornithobacterium rhinotracheale]
MPKSLYHFKEETKADFYSQEAHFNAWEHYFNETKDLFDDKYHLFGLPEYLFNDKYHLLGHNFNL